MTMSDRIAVMDHGRLIQVATPGEIYELPNSRYVADFIGNINILECTVTARSGSAVTLTTPASPSPLTVESSEAVEVGQSVFLAVRPEKLRLDHGPPPPGAVNAIAGKVFDIGYLGDWTNYLVDVPGGKRLRASRANMSRFVERPISWEDDVHVTFAPDAGILLTK